MDRKEFLKLGCDTCLMGAAAMLLPTLSGCSPSYSVFKTTVVNNLIEVPLSLFEKSSIQFVRPGGWQYDIAIQKNSAATYSALLMQCTHQDNQLTPSQNGFSCSLHGSRFNKEGKVIKGPAEVSLKKFRTTTSNNNLIIAI
ncbi:MAG: Rieske (2Fe-2S) protein [Ferruginibacter sp.]